MNKSILLSLAFFSLFNINAYANPTTRSEPSKKEGIGLGVGAIIGGLIAGPPGAILGAASGIWFGNKNEQQDEKISTLEHALNKKQTEIAYLEKQFSDLQYQFVRELQKVKLEKQKSFLKELQQGVTLPVYFRTNRAELEEQTRIKLLGLTEYIKRHGHIQLHLEAHADQRGTELFNKALSKRRAEAVKRFFMEAGLAETRIHIHAFGEDQAKEKDLEGFIYDRRVDITLTINSST